MNNLNIHKLHDVIQGRSYGRGSGKTTAIIYNLIGNIELGENRDIVCMISCYTDLYYLRSLIDSIFKDYGLEIEKRYKDYFICNGKTIRFITKNNTEHIRGLRATVIQLGHND